MADVPQLAERLYTIVEAATDPTSPLCGAVSARTLYAVAKSDPDRLGVVRIGRRVFLTAPGMRAFISAGGTRASAAAPTLTVVRGA